jgi:hypothetical protein
MTAADVSAVIVTRGDVDLTPILNTLPYQDVVVWNDRERGSYGCYGRYLAAAECNNDIVYYQDDDLVFTAHDELLAAYQTGRITCNMPSPWYERTGYDRLDCHLVGAGALVPRDLPWQAFTRYLDRWPQDQLFLDYCDQISGILNPGHRVDLGYRILPHAEAPGRICTTPGQAERKALVQQRALALR